MLIAAVAAGIVIIGIVIGVLIWWQWSRKPRAPEPVPVVEEDWSVPAGALALAQPDNPSWSGSQKPTLVGRLTLVLVGTYGVREGEKIIDAFDRAGCCDAIGGVIVIELDEERRKGFERNIPASMLNRVKACTTTQLPGGLQSKTVEEVESAEWKQFWGPPVRQTVSEAAVFIRRGVQSEVTPGQALERPGNDPAVILVVASPGGHTALGIYASQLLQAEFPQAENYVVTLLSEKDFLRAEFPEGIDRYQNANFVRWYMVTDNLKGDPLHHDTAVARFLAGTWVSTMLSDTVDSPWNTLVGLHPRSKGGVIAPRFWSRTLPVLRSTRRPYRYYTFEDAVIKGVLEGVLAIEKEETKAIELATPAANTNRYVVVTLPIVADFLLDVKDKVTESLNEIGWFAKDRQRHLIWAVTTEAVSTDAGAEMTVVMAEAAVDGIERVKALARAMGQRNGSANTELDGHVNLPLTSIDVVATNGSTAPVNGPATVNAMPAPHDGSLLDH